MTKQEWIELLKTDVDKFNETREEMIDLRGADLSYADLRNANFDFSSFPLWCGSFNFKADMRLVYQLCYHICRLNIINQNGKESKTGKILQKLLMPYANKFHRTEECGLIKEN